MDGGGGGSPLSFGRLEPNSPLCRYFGSQSACEDHVSPFDSISSTNFLRPPLSTYTLILYTQLEEEFYKFQILYPNG
jgi:hypothetical protein